MREHHNRQGTSPSGEDASAPAEPTDEHQHGDCARCGRGHRGGGCCARRGGGRARKGWIRVAILALLAEQPRHGYEMITELAGRTGGAWTPSPGSIYPALQLLADEGLVTVETDGGRRRYSLTQTGRTVVASHDPDDTPWGPMARPSPDPIDTALTEAITQLDAAMAQVLNVGTADQKTQARDTLAETRRVLYLLLAGD